MDFRHNNVTNSTGLQIAMLVGIVMHFINNGGTRLINGLCNVIIRNWLPYINAGGGAAPHNQAYDATYTPGEGDIPEAIWLTPIPATGEEDTGEEDGKITFGVPTGDETEEQKEEIEQALKEFEKENGKKPSEKE